MFYTSTKRVPALLREKMTVDDSVSISLKKEYRHAYMVLNEYERDLSDMTVKVFPTESLARSYAQGQPVVKVKISCEN